MHKQAQAGATVIILFIAALLVAAIAAAVFISSNDKFASAVKTSGDQVQRDVSSIFFVMDIVGTDASDGTIEYLKEIIKLPPGGEALNLNYTHILISTKNSTATLNYRYGGDTVRSNKGFLTYHQEQLGDLGSYYESVPQLNGIAPRTLNVDLDLDGTPDTVVVCELGRGYCPNAYDGKYIKFQLSTDGTYYIRLTDQADQDMNIAIKNNEIYDMTLVPIGTDAYVTITGSEGSTNPYTIFAGQLEVFLKPYTFKGDLDDDGQDDTLVINDTHLIIHYSSDGNVSTQLNSKTGVAYPLGTDLSTGAQTLNTTINLIGSDGTTSYGTAVIKGTTTRASYIDTDVNFTIIPANLNKGYFTTSYPQQSKNYKEGLMQDGDIVRLYYELPYSVGEDENVHLILMNHGGTTTTTDFYTPNILAEHTVTLYPTT